jgi:hypothetical protein
MSKLLTRDGKLEGVVRRTLTSDPDWKEFQIPDLGTRVDYPAAVFS